MASSEIRTLGIIVHRRDFNDADRIVSIFTQTSGVIDAVAKGVRRTRAKLAGNLEPFCVIDFVLVGKSDLKTISGAVLEQEYCCVRDDFEYSFACSAIGELLKYGTLHTDEAADLFALLRNILARFEEGLDPWFGFVIFTLHYLSITGHETDFIHCHETGDLLSDGGMWSRGFLGIRSRSSLADTAFDGGLFISKKHLKLLQVLSHSELSVAVHVDITPNEIRDLVHIVRGFAEGVLERELRSLP